MVNAETEKIILASWLQGENLSDLMLFRTTDFSMYGRIVDVMKGGTIDPISIIKALGMNAAEMSDIITAYSPAMYETAIAEICNNQAKRWLYEHQNATPDEIIKAMQRFTRTQTATPKPPADPVGDFIAEIDRRGREPMVKTGLYKLDLMLCGIRRKELTAVAARPSVGKSAFVQQVSTEVAKQNKKVLYFPLEMSRNALIQRMFLKYVNVPQVEIRNGKADLWKRPGVAEAIDKIHNFFSSGNWLIFERCNNLKDIRELIKVHHPHMIVIDQLEQLRDGDLMFRDKRERFSHMTHALQEIALDEDVAVWFACQLNRGADNSKPTLANLKESGTIEEDSDNVILLHRESEERGADQMVTLELAKQRDGECGSFDMVFKAPKFAFYSYEKGDY